MASKLCDVKKRLWFVLLIIYLGFGIYWIVQLNLAKPKWLLSQPGLTCEPSKIEYHQDSLEEINKYAKHINTTLGKYGQIPKDYFGDCVRSNDYGYKEREPCIYLKINRFNGFKTQVFDELNKMPFYVPEDLLEYLETLNLDERKQRLWISCYSIPDLNFEYYPRRFYDVADVDYNEGSGKETPFANNSYKLNVFKHVVAVKIKNIRFNTRYDVYCSLWAKNIVVSARENLGVVKTSIKIET